MPYFSEKEVELYQGAVSILFCLRRDAVLYDNPVLLSCSSNVTGFVQSDFSTF
jgi:hypothetical protein